MSVRKKEILTSVTRVFLGLVLASAGLPKLMDIPAFAESVYNYKLAPAFLVYPVAYALPPLEVLLGVCLLAGFLVHGAALLGAMLFTVFTLSFDYPTAPL